jgi:hypothetical protein
MDHAANLSALMEGGSAIGHAMSGNVGTAAVRGINAVRNFAPDFLRSGGMNADTRNALGKLLMQSPDDLASYVQQLPPPQKASTLAKLLGEQ